MGKSYLRYAPFANFGSIYAAHGNAILDSTEKLAICASQENVTIWHLRQGTKVGEWHDEDNKARVTYITRGNSLYAVGYEDGSIRIWNMAGECLIRFNGHKSAVTYLLFNKSGSRLVSGSKDTDIIAWDIAGEVGLFRLKGHKDQITSLALMTDDKYLISSSKDTLIKVWDMQTQFCIETVVGHRSEVWSLCLVKGETLLVCGSSESEMKVFTVDKDALAARMNVQTSSDDLKEIQGIKAYGNIVKASKERVASLSLDSSGRFLACHTADRSVEFYAVKDEKELKDTLRRKKKKQKDSEEAVKLEASDEIVSKRVYKAKHKVGSFQFLSTKSAEKEVSFLLGFTNNTVAVFKMSAFDEITDLSTVDHQGHTGEIRVVALSSDDSMLLSACDRTIKIWNTVSQSCIRTIQTANQPTCGMFLPGNRHILLGTREGTIDLYDSQSSTLLESVTAHHGAIWSVDLRPDQGGVMSGGDDKTVKFWDFGAIEDPEYSKITRRLTMFHMRTLELSDQVRCVKYSPDQRIVAVSLLDSTIKIFYHDTLKFFLSLYGHKLPVISMDISSDSSILISGSADKSVKIFGLDFGDCHKSMLAHGDSVMQVQFVPNTHYFFTCSKDKTLKYWDADNFEQIMTVGKHQGEIRAMCLGRWGNLVVTSGQDRTIRIWERTDEQIFLEEEREKEMDEQIESELINSDEQEEDSAARKSAQSLKESERLIEALIITERHWEDLLIYEKSEGRNPKPDLNPIVKAFNYDTPELYVLHVLSRVKSPDLEPCLWSVPFAKVPTLLSVVLYWIERRLNAVLTTRVLSFLLKSYLNQLITSSFRSADGSSIHVLLQRIKLALHKSLEMQKDCVGFNLAGLKIVKNLWEQEHVSELMDFEAEIQTKIKEVKSKSKRK